MDCSPSGSSVHGIFQGFIYDIFFIQSSVGGHLGCFHVSHATFINTEGIAVSKLISAIMETVAGGQTQLRLLQSLCLLATREKANVEVALSTFVEMAQAEVCWLPGWAGGRHVEAEGRAPRCLLPACTEGQRPRPAGHGAGLLPAEAGPQWSLHLAPSFCVSVCDVCGAHVPGSGSGNECVGESE